jgi:hypothetical protein
MQADLLAPGLPVIGDALLPENGARFGRGPRCCPVDVVLDGPGDLRTTCAEPVTLVSHGLASGEGQELGETSGGWEVLGMHERGVLVEGRQLERGAARDEEGEPC